MKFIVMCILITTVNGRNSKNVELNELPEEKLLDAVCRSFRKRSTPSFLCDLHTCDWNNESLPLTKFNIKNESTLDLPKLICKDHRMANLFMGPSDDFAYFFEIGNANENSTVLTNVTMCSHYTIKNLTNDTDYNIRVWAASYSKKEIIHSDVMKLEILNENTVPSPVTNILVQNITCEENSCEAIVGWSPNKDYSCEYDLVWVKEGSINEDRINVISGFHQAELKDLKFDTKYTVQIMARNHGSLHESLTKSLNFVTPSCLNIFHSLDKCRPEAPKHLLVTETIVDSSTETLILYNVQLSWEKPDLVPTYYIAQFSNLVDYNTTEKKLNITGNETEAIFENVKLDKLYHVSLMACSPVGCSARIADERHRTDAVAIDVSSHRKWRMLTLILVPLVAVMIGTLIINYCRGKQKRRDERERYFRGLEKLPESAETIEINLIKPHVADQWELDPGKLHFQSIIGEGAFGVVRMAYLEIANSTKTPVAVKMLKESPSSDEIRQFTQEINIMKSVRQHPYIVSLIGCITKGRVEGPLLVVEYCSRGDLQTYLRTAWDKFCSMHQDLNSDETTNNQRNYFANKTYDFHAVNSDDEFIIQAKHLLSIARQVALGMEHLSKTRVVHRDLAARNVLVCENHTVKVSDFGLSRDIYRDNVYCKSSGGKLPIRWMALESLTHQRYTTHSDVWSFGILLWEIVTLGGTPYVGLHASDLLEFLKSGNRLSRPSNCSPELYAIMQSCWKTSPKNRPTFTELCKSLEDLLEHVSYYLQLENVELPLNCDTTKPSSNNSSQSITSSEHYFNDTVNKM